jgi:EpsI family protein
MDRQRQLKNLQIIFIILLAAMSLGMWLDYGQKQPPPGIDLNGLSNTVGTWEGANLPKSSEDRKRAAAGDLVIREYVSKEDALFLIAIQERGDRHRVHSPLNCYTGSGWTVLEKKTVVLEGDKKVRRLLVNRNEAYRLVYYWFTNGNARSTGFLEHLFLYAADMLMGQNSAAWVYFDISADITDSIEKTEDRMKDFVSELEQLSLFNRTAQGKATL